MKIRNHILRIQRKIRDCMNRISLPGTRNTRRKTKQKQRKCVVSPLLCFLMIVFLWSVVVEDCVTKGFLHFLVTKCTSYGILPVKLTQNRCYYYTAVLYLAFHIYASISCHARYYAYNDGQEKQLSDFSSGVRFANNSILNIITMLLQHWYLLC